MNRRDFLLSSSAAASLASLPGRARSVAADPALSAALVRENDREVPLLLAQQEQRAGHRYFGALPDEHGIHTAGGTARLISVLACAVSAPGSKYFGAPALAKPLRQAAAGLKALQHEDGTIDLHVTNFRSPPDTAFIVESVAPSTALLCARPEPEFAAAAEELGRFLRRAGDALLTGGIHTPNHRWVVCAALAWIHALYPDPRYVARIDAWLAETIDIDPDGQYTERSTTVYSPIVNRALITVARLLRRPALLDPVRRNLDMTLYYVHPDGEVVTEASRRQDQYQRGTMSRYHYAYRWLALHDRDGRFAAMTRQIERTATPSQLRGELPAFLVEPNLQKPLPPDAPLPTDYARVFAHSQLVRIRRGNASGTILAQNSTLLSYRRGAAALEAVRLATAFFGKGQFVAPELIQQDGAWVLRQELEGPYYQPFTAEQIARSGVATGGALPSRTLREKSNVQRLTASVTVRETEGTFTLAIAVDGAQRVPVAVELAFRHGGKLEGVEPLPGLRTAFLLRAGEGRYQFGSDTIRFGPGHAEHTYTQLRGALPKWEGQSVYLTGLTPFTSTLTIG